jgi:hypothetical protein
MTIREWWRMQELEFYCDRIFKTCGDWTVVSVLLLGDYCEQ